MFFLNNDECRMVLYFFKLTSGVLIQVHHLFLFKLGKFRFVNYFSHTIFKTYEITM